MFPEIRKNASSTCLLPLPLVTVHVPVRRALIQGLTWTQWAPRSSLSRARFALGKRHELRLQFSSEILTLGDPWRKLRRAPPKVPELSTQKEQLLIHSAICIPFACFFEYTLHVAPLKSKAHIPPPLPFPPLPPFSFLSHSLGEHPPTCWAHICLGSSGPTKHVGDRFVVRC